MKRLSIILTLLAVLPWSVAAQIDNSVEVTKEYRPSVERASKIAVEPDMTDTVKIYPEIDYTITPLSMTTSFATRPIRPATLTYWDFNRTMPLYLKVGAGYPLSSVVDLYASTHNRERGYLVGSINHTGDFGRLRNAAGVLSTAWQTDNRARVAAGRYFNGHAVEGAVSYENNIYHRYGLTPAPAAGVPRSMTGEACLDLRVGDDFTDLSRLNFEVSLGGSMFDGRPDTGAPLRGRQLSVGAAARIARHIGRSSHHRFSASAAYDHSFGAKALDGAEQGRVMVGVRYGHDGGTIDFEAGADFNHLRTRLAKGADPAVGDYFLPYLRLGADLGGKALRPFIEIDGEVEENSYRTLVAGNRYLDGVPWLDRATVIYRGRLGIGGAVDRDRFSYRLFAQFEIDDNWRYIYSALTLDDPAAFDESMGGALGVLQARRTVTSVNAECEFRPIPELLMGLDAHLYIYNHDAKDYYFSETERSQLEGGEPLFRGNFSLRYENDRLVAGMGLGMESRRTWSAVAYGGDTTMFYDFEAPFALDLNLLFEWKLSHRLHLFAEGRNLADRSIYRTAWYRDRGASFIMGAKLNF